ncbi:MAG: cell division protein FtsL [Bacillota bacterium]|nr:cell division protein FtsL [Bacillota bacterium]
MAKENLRTVNYQEQRSRNSHLPREKSYDLPHVRPKRVQAHCGSLLLCGILLCLVMTSVGLIAQYGRLVAGSYQLQQMRREIHLLQEERERLHIEVNRLGSLERIEEIAVNELGLQYPEKRQWLILSARGN